MLFFFFNDPATTEIYTLSLHDALPICTGDLSPLKVIAVVAVVLSVTGFVVFVERGQRRITVNYARDRKSTRLNSSHSSISYAVFCLKKKKNNTNHTRHEGPSRSALRRI